MTTVLHRQVKPIVVVVVVVAACEPHVDLLPGVYSFGSSASSVTCRRCLYLRSVSTFFPPPDKQTVRRRPRETQRGQKSGRHEGRRLPPIKRLNETDHPLYFSPG